MMSNIWRREISVIRSSITRSFYCASRPNAGNKIGTTNRGIGPSYTDKVRGIRLGDLLDREEFAERLAAVLQEKNELITAVYGAVGL